MFLIQYRERCFIDAEKIELIKYTTDGEVRFYTVSDAENDFAVDKEFTVSFINKIQELDKLHTNIKYIDYKLGDK